MSHELQFIEVFCQQKDECAGVSENEAPYQDVNKGKVARKNEIF